MGVTAVWPQAVAGNNLEGNLEENAFPLPGRLHFNPINYAFLI